MFDAGLGRAERVLGSRPRGLVARTDTAHLYERAGTTSREYRSHETSRASADLCGAGASSLPLSLPNLPISEACPGDAADLLEGPRPWIPPS